MNDFDPQKPYIASDGIEYACVADRLLGTPRESFYNAQIARYQENAGEAAATKIAQFRRDYCRYRADPRYLPHLEEGQLDSGGRLSFAAARSDFYDWSLGFRHRRSPEGTRVPDPGQAPADPVHPEN